jgi:hypothetical protein
MGGGGKDDKASGGKGEKGGGKRGESSSLLSGKPYKKSADETLKNTKVRSTDFDQKAVQLLDYFHTKGQAIEACNFLKQAADGVEREDIVNWRAYVYTLLKKSNPPLYLEMKEKSGGADARRSGGGGGRAADRIAQSEAELSLEAPEFVPGQTWGGNVSGSLMPGAQGGASPLPPQWTPTVNFHAPAFFGTQPLASFRGKGNAGFDPRMGPPPPPPVPVGGLPCGGKKSEGKGKKGEKKKKGEGKKAGVGPQPPVGEASPPADGPLPSGLPSIGSVGHANKTCKPCAFFHSKGCASGAACQFCHLCDAGEKKVRKKDQKDKERSGQVA